MLPPAAPAAQLGLVTGTRQGRSVVYALYDNHVAELLGQALYHVEHLQLGLTDTPAGRGTGTNEAAHATARWQS